VESLDVNLVVALDALLTDNSVTGAAERLHTSAPTMTERARALFAPAPAADPTSIVRTFDLPRDPQ
jgi:hypothetical protein